MSHVAGVTNVASVKFTHKLHTQFLVADFSIVKSRPIAGDNENSVVMKLDKIRHFIFVKDKKKFADKRPTAIFRGKVGDKELRMEFMRKFYLRGMAWSLTSGDSGGSTTGHRSLL